MKSIIRVNPGKLLLSLSDAIELAGPDIAQYQQRTAFVVWQMRKSIGIIFNHYGEINSRVKKPQIKAEAFIMSSSQSECRPKRLKR